MKVLAALALVGCAHLAAHPEAASDTALNRIIEVTKDTLRMHHQEVEARVVTRTDSSAVVRYTYRGKPGWFERTYARDPKAPGGWRRVEDATSTH
jgi:hypothetical protein